MNKRTIHLILIMSFWFTISFITNILGPLIPDIINNFNLSNLAMAGFIPTSFFLAYAIMSIPSGILIDKYGEKPVLFCGFLMPLIGSVLFATIHTYPALLASSFIIGLGMAMLQTVINPLQRLFRSYVAFVFGCVCTREQYYSRCPGVSYSVRPSMGFTLLDICGIACFDAHICTFFPFP